MFLFRRPLNIYQSKTEGKPYDVANGHDREGNPCKVQVHYAVSLNRSQHWDTAKSYAEARALAPDPSQPLR